MPEQGPFERQPVLAPPPAVVPEFEPGRGPILPNLMFERIGHPEEGFTHAVG